MSAWHGIYADVLRQRFSDLVAYGVVLTGDRDAGRALAQRATESVFARARAPHGVAQAERAVRAAMIRLSLPDAGAGGGADGQGGDNAGRGDAAGGDNGGGAGGDAGAGPGDAPRSHREIRVWLATLGPYERAAAVLHAVDGMDEHGIRHALGRGSRAPGDPIPDAHANAVRALYRDEAATYASPAGGVTGVIAASRRARRESLTRRAVFAGTAAAVVVVVGFAAAKTIDFTGFSAAQSPTPEPSLTAVAFDPTADVEDAMDGFALPECGDVWAPGPVEVNGIIPAAEVLQESMPGERPTMMVVQNFEFGDAERVPLLYVPSLVVVTLEDEVVYTLNFDNFTIEDFGAEYAAPNRITRDGRVLLDRMSMCDARAAWNEEFAGINWETLTDAERQAAEDAGVAMWERWSELEPGTYRIYSVVPMMFGEQAALAQEIIGQGVLGLNELRWNLASTEFANDPRIAPYCAPVDYGGGPLEVECTPPEEVLAKVLTRDIDPAAINDWEPGVGISEPVEIVVPPPS